MKKATLLLITLVLMAAPCFGGEPLVRLHTHGDFATCPAGQTWGNAQASGAAKASGQAVSAIEPVFGLEQTLAPANLLPADLPSEQLDPRRPRMVRLRDGRYMMVYQGGRLASRVYYITSPDFRDWSKYTRVLSPMKRKIAGADRWARYSDPDLCVLSSGEIVLTSAWRTDDYSRGIGGGIMMIKCRDGVNFSRASYFYDGAAWDPCTIELPDGTLQCWFSDANPKTGSFCTSMLQSTDDGRTWQDKVCTARQAKGFSGGEKVYTGRSPWVRLLSDGRTAFGLLEGVYDSEGAGEVSSLSAMWNDAWLWNAASGKDAPSSLKKELTAGSSPSVGVFPSGEVAIACMRGGFLSLKVGDAAARTFPGKKWEDEWQRLSKAYGLWGSVSVVDDHHLAWASDCSGGLCIGMGYLNHPILAPSVVILSASEGSAPSPVLTGDPAGWAFCREALFVGSDSPLHAVIRSCRDDQYLYLLAEVTGPAANVDASFMELNLRGMRSGKILKGENLTVLVRKLGLMNAPDGVDAVCRAGKTDDGTRGYAAEIRIPLRLLSSPDEVLLHTALLNGRVRDEFAMSNIKKPETWQHIVLK